MSYYGPAGGGGLSRQLRDLYVSTEPTYFLVCFAFCVFVYLCVSIVN